MNRQRNRKQIDRSTWESCHDVLSPSCAVEVSLNVPSTLSLELSVVTVKAVWLIAQALLQLQQAGTVPERKQIKQRQNSSNLLALCTAH